MHSFRDTECTRRPTGLTNKRSCYQHKTLCDSPIHTIKDLENPNVEISRPGN